MVTTMVPGWNGLLDRALSMEELSPRFPWNATDGVLLRVQGGRSLSPDYLQHPRRSTLLNTGVVVEMSFC